VLKKGEVGDFSRMGLGLQVTVKVGGIATYFRIVSMPAKSPTSFWGAIAQKDGKCGDPRQRFD
jgi:hypothetical protein